MREKNDWLKPDGFGQSIFYLDGLMKISYNGYNEANVY